jgi:PHD/YefM family antitoxin component YafN of YafNO toxin-antitoxin module
LDYLESLEETLYQISNPANRKHLEKSIKEGEIGDKVFKYKNVTELADELGIDLD